MSQSATFPGGGVEELNTFIAEQRQRMKPFRRVLITADRARILDVNRNELVFPGVTCGHPLLEALLRAAGATFDPATCHTPPAGNHTREFGCTARYPWAHDRIL